MAFTFSHLVSAVEDMSQTIRKQDFLTYFKKFSLITATDTSITIWVVSSFHLDNLSKKFYDDIKKSVIQVYPTIEVIDFVVDDTIDMKKPEEVIDCRIAQKKSEKQVRNERAHGVEVVDGVTSRLVQHRYQLDNFVVWPNTQLAHAACDAVARKPWSSYNPLYVYGNVWLWKTHLLQGTANCIKQKYKWLRVVYTTADKFLTDYVASIKKRSVDKLRERYRQIDVLVLDDVQFLAGKKQTQEELYNIFNILYEAWKQIVLSGDRPPRELTELEARLQSRFEWGITVDVGEPDYETRLAIIGEKSRAREFLLPQNVAEFIAENVTTNVREIEGILNQIIAENDLKGTPPTLENVALRLSKLSIRSLTPAITTSKSLRSTYCSYEDLIQTVSWHFGIEIRALLSEDRRKENMIPRQVAMYLLKNKLNYTYERIGNIFSGRNHTAVMYSCRKLEEIMKKDQQIVYELNVIRDRLGI